MSDGKVRVGPFTFEFLPDGDDQCVGQVDLGAESGYWARTETGVPRSEWEAFVEAAR